MEIKMLTIVFIIIVLAMKLKDFKILLQYVKQYIFDKLLASLYF